MKRITLLSCMFLALGCASSTRRFPLAEPLWRDPDQATFAAKPAEYYSPMVWDGIDNSMFRPVSQFFAVRPGGEAVNVNALDEVPDSSWFENRVAPLATSRDALGDGPCMGKPPLDPAGPWIITSGKPAGYNPGFVIKAPDGRKFVVKMETDQPERASSGDVISSRLYFAAGFYAPCNTIVYVRPDLLQIGPEATTEEEGKTVKLDPQHLRDTFARAIREPDGTYRAMASLWLDGDSLGPWRYRDVRDDDPNDIVPHEDRRDLRGSRLIAAWVLHHDAREGNTLATWIIDAAGRGYVRHNFIDWGDTLGGLWDWDALSRRTGHSYYLDFGEILGDWVTLGIPTHPWEHVQFGPGGRTLGYFDVDSFDPEKWTVGYPNPAFSRMTERDAAWMARIIARIDEPSVDAVVDRAKLRSPVVDAALRRILKGRREKILRRYLGRLSPLTAPKLEGDKLCLEDLVVTAKLEAAPRGYVLHGYVGDALEEVPMPDPTSPASGRVCAKVPRAKGASKASPAYVIVDVVGVSPAFPKRAPARVHLYDLGDELRIVGLERPEDETRPHP